MCEATNKSISRPNIWHKGKYDKNCGSFAFTFSTNEKFGICVATQEIFPWVIIEPFGFPVVPEV